MGAPFSAGAQDISERPHKISDARLLVANTVIGAATAGIYRLIGHKPVAAGAARGAVAGAAVFAGKRLIGIGRPGYWWLGRELSSVAASEVANAGLGRPALQQIVLPVGPIRFHIDRLARRKISPRLDVISSVLAVVARADDGSRLGWRESLATGTLVFIVPETTNQIGSATGAIVSVSELAPDGKFPPLESKRSILAHEMTHVSQWDFTFNALTGPARQFVERRNPSLKSFARYVDVNLYAPFDVLIEQKIDYKNQPWEREAVSMALHAP